MKIGFIGTGKISSAVTEAICKSKQGDNIINLSPRNKERSETLAAKYPEVNRWQSNQEVLNKSDIVFIALKPDVYDKVIDELSFSNHHIVVSLVPYTNKSIVQDLVKPAKSVTRAIPLPAVVNHNCPIPVFSPVEEVMNILSSIGKPLVIDDEDQLHVLWTLTGLITPFYDLLSSLSDWSVNNGVKKEIADKYIADMFMSLSFAAGVSSETDFGILSDHAATPGGMNENSGKEINNAGAHRAYTEAAEKILGKFKAIKP
ncbi:MAG: NAD(P)-binding domain-containing protein [Bacteroidales bacterium]|nr:NAD(P)-binding domain-containing protein [Bacteroidales bacterium]